MKKRLLGLVIGIFLTFITGLASAASVVSVTAPYGHADRIMVDFNTLTQFSLHSGDYSNAYDLPYVPNPTMAVVTYQFDKPVLVNALTVEQHANGITKIQGFAGDSLESLTSIGTASDTGYTFAEFSLSNFNFGSNIVAGTYFQFVIRETVAATGYATYAMHPVFSEAPVSATPVPAAVWLFGSGLVGLAGLKKRRSKK